MKKILFMSALTIMLGVNVMADNYTMTPDGNYVKGNSSTMCSSRFIRTPSQKYSDSLKVEIF